MSNGMWNAYYGNMLVPRESSSAINLVFSRGSGDCNNKIFLLKSKLGGGKRLKLIGFTSWHDKNYSFIGDFEDEHFAEKDIEWINYEETMMAWEVTVDYLRHHGIKFSGIYHQKGKYGVPYFDNGKKLCLDNQSWGYLMAETLELKLVSDMTWCKWAWWVEPNEFVLPYDEQPDDIFHWKNDPIAKSMMERYLEGGTSI